MSVKGPSDAAAGGTQPSASTPTTARTRNPQGQGGRLRTELIRAADSLLARSGDVEGLSLRAVAREVGIATPSIYLHFPDKRALVRAVLEARFAELAQAVEAAVVAAPDPVAKLKAGCLAYCRFATAHPNAYRVLFGRMPARQAGHTERAERADVAATADDRQPAESPPAQTPHRATTADMGGPPDPAGRPFALADLGAGAAAFGFLVEGVAACIRAGIAPPGDPFRVATALWTALHGIVSLRTSVPGFPWPPLEQQVDDAVIGLVGLAPLHHNPPPRAEP